MARAVETYSATHSGPSANGADTMATPETPPAHFPVAFVAAVFAHVVVTVFFACGIAAVWEGRILLALGIGVVATAGWVAYLRALSDDF
jgi:hypothetical protein